MADARASLRLAVDIGGTFTDIVLDADGQRTIAKVLTTPRAPEEGVIEGVESALRQASLAASCLSLVLHGTTLATNAIIERKGAARPAWLNADSTPSITPSSGALGVVRTFAVVRCPSASSTISVNVPPISTASRTLARASAISLPPGEPSN